MTLNFFNFLLRCNRPTVIKAVKLQKNGKSHSGVLKLLLTMWGEGGVFLSLLQRRLLSVQNKNTISKNII